MARPKKEAFIDLNEAQDLTAGLIERLACPPGKLQAFLRDTKAPGLRVRVTAAGAKSFVFEGKLHRQTIRRTIGDIRAWRIEAARNEANRLRVTLDGGIDPRDVDRQQLAEKAEKASAAAAHAVTVGEAWTEYLEARRQYWGDRHYRDHTALCKPGGQSANRGTRGRGITIAGPLHALMAVPLRDLNAPTVEAWAEREANIRPTVARLAWRCLKAFLGWCSEQPQYGPVLQTINSAKTKKTRETLGKDGIKQDALMREQLSVWFQAVRQLHNPVASAYLQTLLLTGARPGEVLALRWDEINVKWRGLTIRDKVEGERVIPLTPYVSQLLHALPRRNQFVFSSTTAEAGMLTIPRNQHGAACNVAGIDGLTLHGLRRSFKSLTEWLEVPAGVVAQLMGHKPSATAEKHYTVRPLDLLRVHHEKIEAWILQQAELSFEIQSAPGPLQVVGSRGG